MTDPTKTLHIEPALAWKMVVNVLAAAPESVEAARAAETTRHSPLVATLLSERLPDGSLPHHPYKKWNGGHWTLAALADLGIPPGEQELRPLLEPSCEWLLGAGHDENIHLIAGRTRRCASQEGNLLWYSLRLGLSDGRADELAARLMKWQWADGGWNCDKRPEALNSSFMESLLPLRALSLYARLSGDRKAGAAAERAAEIFLKRRMFLRLSDGELIDKHFVRLCYPPYWHYNILAGLKVMAEAGFLTDPRCAPALDLLSLRRLPDGGFPADESYSRTTRPSLSGYSLVAWGGMSRVKTNPFVTADALYVLRVAGRA